VSLPVFQKEATKQKDELTFGINGIVIELKSPIFRPSSFDTIPRSAPEHQYWAHNQVKLIQDSHDDDDPQNLEDVWLERLKSMVSMHHTPGRFHSCDRSNSGRYGLHPLNHIFTVNTSRRNCCSLNIRKHTVTGITAYLFKIVGELCKLG
jgi:hypothetical protein